MDELTLISGPIVVPPKVNIPTLGYLELALLTLLIAGGSLLGLRRRPNAVNSGSE